jgi:2-oxoglutarate ferredoxin oxidoreductase subunit alpha
MPSQADLMQAHWGSHGDYPAIALSPASVAECFPVMVRAFTLAERFRTPVTVLTDEVVGHMREDVDAKDMSPPRTPIARRRPSGSPDGYLHYGYELSPDGPVMADFGTGYRFHVTGLAHKADGFPTNDPVEIERCNRRILDKVERYRDDIAWNETAHLEGADVLVVSFGISARVARAAVHRARSQDRKVGFFRPVLLWPFPAQALEDAAADVRAVVCVEMNAGQMAGEVRKVVGKGVPVLQVNRLDGTLIEVEAVETAVREALA